MGDGPAAEGRGADRLDGERRVEEPHAPGQDDRVTASARSPVAIVVSGQSAEASEFENTILGISFIGLANGPAAPGPNVARRA